MKRSAHGHCVWDMFQGILSSLTARTHKPSRAKCMQASLLLQNLAVDALPGAVQPDTPAVQQIGTMVASLLRPVYVYGVSAVQSRSTCDTFIRVCKLAVQLRLNAGYN